MSHMRQSAISAPEQIASSAYMSGTDTPENRRQDSNARRSKTPPETKSALIRNLLKKQAFPLIVTLIVAWILWGKCAQLNISEILATLSMVQPLQWIGALIAAAGSFWAVGTYDCVLHAQLGTGISRRSAKRSGIAAIGLSQFLGFGALTGALIRWRMLPEMTLWQAARLSAAVALSFLAGWAVVASLAVLLLQPDIPWMKTLAAFAIALAATMALLSIYPPARLVRFPWPTVRTMGTVVMLAAIDTLLAGLSLYILLPPDISVGLGQLISAYLFALGAGLVGSTPGGIGPFEGMLASLLPMAPLESLLGAVLAYRIVYYVVPASLAGLLVLRGSRGSNLAQTAQLKKTNASAFLSPKIEMQLFSAPRAETNLLRTRDFSLLTGASGENLALAAPIGQSLVMLSDPLNAKACTLGARGALQDAAKARYRMPALYKCGARMAACARRDGWAVIPTAQEAWLTPSQFTVDGPARRQLRRYLKKARDAGVTVREGGRELPLESMGRVAAQWKKNRGKERGFSMGTYDPDYVICQRVFLAYKEGELVAFITLHESRNELTLDLMRSTPDAPNGTIQLLITAALEAAADSECPRLSLAAIPWAGEDANGLVRRLRALFLKKSGYEGLKRFKSAFNPNWETLYLAAPSGLALAIASMDIVRRVTAPTPAARRSELMLKVRKTGDRKAT